MDDDCKVQLCSYITFSIFFLSPTSPSLSHPPSRSGGKQIQMNESRKGVKAVYYQLSLFPSCRSHTLSQCQEKKREKKIRRFADREGFFGDVVKKG